MNNIPSAPAMPKPPPPRPHQGRNASGARNSHGNRHKSTSPPGLSILRSPLPPEDFRNAFPAQHKKFRILPKITSTANLHTTHSFRNNLQPRQTQQSASTTRITQYVKMTCDLVRDVLPAAIVFLCFTVVICYYVGYSVGVCRGAKAIMLFELEKLQQRRRMRQRQQ
ncbi:hypothetical protein F5Y06DRAFT_291971 [Hypoxylon sp. FL0890]|nr:hypothetical protein F5Y06DRAFT_291971 [Hypoxylon sp. FL0890]